MVELIVWDKVPESFITYIEGRFRASRLQLHTTYLHHNDVDKNTLMQHFVIEGVTAVIMVDRNDEAQGKLYMQVFRRSGTANDSNVHFDGMFLQSQLCKVYPSFRLMHMLFRIRWYIC